MAKAPLFNNSSGRVVKPVVAEPSKSFTQAETGSLFSLLTNKRELNMGAFPYTHITTCFKQWEENMPGFSGALFTVSPNSLLLNIYLIY